jgi:homogentisate 1,2-dioxygenase
MDYFYRNAQAYETWWVHEGNGMLKSQFGNLKFRKGDYIVIPFGTTWQMHLDNGEARFFTTLPVDLQHRGLRAHHRTSPPASAGTSNLPGA